MYFILHKLVHTYYYLDVEPVPQKPIDLPRIGVSMIHSYVCLPKKDAPTKTTSKNKKC